MDRVLVTGGTGFLGRHVISLLTKAALQSTSYSRTAFTNHAGDIRDLDSLRAAMEGISDVVHLAVSPGHAADSDPRRDLEVNVLGTLNVLLAASETRVRRVVHASSAHVYGASAGFVSEDAPRMPSTLYGVSKKAAEEYVAMFVRSRGLAGTVLRFSPLYGSALQGEPPPNLVTRFTALAMDGRPIVLSGDPEHPLDLLHVEDAARAVLEALGSERAIGQTYNIGSGNPVSLRVVAETIVEACRSSSVIETSGTTPAGILPLLDISKAHRELGFRPTIEPRAGLRRYVRERLELPSPPNPRSGGGEVLH